VVGACFRGADVWASIIVDGLHSDFESVKLAKQIKGDKLFLITDAVTGDQSGPYKFARDAASGKYLTEVICKIFTVFFLTPYNVEKIELLQSL
jgi:N-acetylglucosamine-6-phosphate deacetylase